MSASFCSLRVALGSPKGTAALTRASAAPRTSTARPFAETLASISANSPTVTGAALFWLLACSAATEATGNVAVRTSTSSGLEILMMALLWAGMSAHHDPPVLYGEVGGQSTGFVFAVGESTPVTARQPSTARCNRQPPPLRSGL